MSCTCMQTTYMYKWKTIGKVHHPTVYVTMNVHLILLWEQLHVPVAYLIIASLGIANITDGSIISSWSWEKYLRFKALKEEKKTHEIT